ncbi:chromosome partitioning protein, ParB family [Noviherbaspirillum humi]|uniref:Chromosome partitioning protein, ParB family n=1 Tax=Noviherbaspirillum humi TaxID=1688639 RepID=A0A239FHT5_9BURK|nr:ParB/RepB/Spo0J family partition protein [Noviherbaspirillum humi]SNS55624.1 chromosome partitioning protein, ParB family [Noviherbaspirillum humi]
MSMKDRLAAKAASIGSNPRNPPASNEPAPRAKTAPGQLMSSLPFLAEKEKEIEAKEKENAELREKLKAAEEGAAAREISLSELHEVAGRRRRLSDEQYSELRENLRNNPLVQAITVRRRNDGSFEIISGHNRVAAYRELGRESIPAVILDTEDDYVTEASALYANLFQPDLSDYEKYLGFKKLLLQTGKTQRELAQESGADEKSVSRWMSFDDLPEEVLSIIATEPSRLGGKAAMALASIAKEGKTEAVINAVQAIISGKLTQDAGVKYAKENKPEASKPARPQSIAIRSGKSVFCKMTAAKQTLRIDFPSEEQRIAVEEAIREVLDRLAKEAK